MGMFVEEREGAEPAVVCIHGFCQSSAYWTRTLDLLASRGVRGIAPDLPGFGRSSGEPGPYTMSALADAVVRLLDTRRIERVRLLGGSMGGVVAQQIVLNHPQRVERLVLVATGAVMNDPKAGLAKSEEFRTSPWNEALVEPIVAGFFYRVPPQADIARFRRIALGASQAAAVEASRSNAQNNTLDRLAEIRVPTLIVQGRHDKARTPEHGALMRERIPGAKLAVIDDAGHTPQLEQVHAFHEVALRFLIAH